MKKTIALALALLLMLALCACGGGKNAAVGTWEIRSMTSGEETLSVDEVPALKNYIVIELKADGTGTITSGGETLPLTWDATTITVEGDPANYKVSGDELTITSGQLSFVLARR